MRWVHVFGVVLAVVLAGCSGLPQGDAETDCTALGTTGDTYDSATVRVLGPNGSTRGVVTATVADSPRERCIGLSRTDSLGPDEGMLFVFDDTAERTFVMREMAFPLDIVFVDGDGTITEIHSAPTEEPPLTRYEGRAKYVLEVPRGWTTTNGVSPGDRLVVSFAAE
jgi:uncharacterized membrane protein (UPF0127 family)